MGVFLAFAIGVSVHDKIGGTLLYQMICENCQATYEICQSINKNLTDKCQICKEHALRQDYSQNIGVFASARAADGELDKMTLGQYAERNTKRLGGKIDEMKEAERLKKEKYLDSIDLGPGRKVVNTAKIKAKEQIKLKRKDGKELDKNKYIQTGKKVYKSPD